MFSSSVVFSFAIGLSWGSVFGENRSGRVRSQLSLASLCHWRPCHWRPCPFEVELPFGRSADGSLCRFSVIACRSIVNPYLQALDPRDQIFEEEEVHVPRKRKPTPQEQAEQEAAAREATPPQQAEGIDNPFLRPPKMPRKRKH